MVEIAAMKESVAVLKRRAKNVRSLVVRMAHEGQTPHVGSALSTADLLVGLFFHAMKADPQERAGGDQDRFVLSKGHGCMAYYAVLAERGYFPHDLLSTYARDGSLLAEHPIAHAVRGIEVATGSLGHGLSIAVGAAMGRRMDRRSGRHFVLLSDGECQEGSVWEAAMVAAGQRLSGLTAIVDYNKLTATGRTDEITGRAPLADKWRAFGFGVREIDGHDLAQIVDALDALPVAAERPSAIIAHTVKGKGVSFMEDDLEWHYRPPSAADLAQALHEIEVA